MSTRTKCVNCTLLEKKGDDLYFCDYCGTYFSEVSTYRPIQCDAFRDKCVYVYAEDEDGNATMETTCFHCGKKIYHGQRIPGNPIEDIYCEDCKPLQTALDNRKLELSIQDKATTQGLMRAVVQQAIRDYRSVLGKIKKTPMSIARHAERKELEEYFFSNDFRNQIDFIFDNDGHENDDGRFEFHVVKLLNRLRKECDYDPSKYDF